jgi:hypothetical protein
VSRLKESVMSERLDAFAHMAIPSSAGGLRVWGVVCPFPFALEVLGWLEKMPMTLSF